MLSKGGFLYLCTMAKPKKQDSYFNEDVVEKKLPKNYDSYETLFINISWIRLTLISNIANDRKVSLDKIIEEAIDIYLKTD